MIRDVLHDSHVRRQAAEHLSTEHHVRRQDAEHLSSSVSVTARAGSRAVLSCQVNVIQLGTNTVNNLIVFLIHTVKLDLVLSLIVKQGRYIWLSTAVLSAT